MPFQRAGVYLTLFLTIEAKRPSKYDESTWLCIKVGRGQGDGDIGTRVWGLGLGNARRGTWGRQVWDAGTSKTRTQGTRDVNDYCKSRR